MHAMDSARVVPDRLTEIWRDGLERGEFLLQRSVQSGQYQYYPREHCVAEPTSALEWAPASGTGVIYSFTVVRRSPNEAFIPELPYVLAIVELDEGVRITTRIQDADPDTLKCGSRVAVRFGVGRDDLPHFVPIEIEDTHS